MSRLDAQQVQGIIRPGDLELAIKRAQLTVDESWAPHAQATVVCKIPADRDLVDLRENVLELDLRLLRTFGRSWNIADISADVGGSMAAASALYGGRVGAVTNRHFKPFRGSLIRAGELLQAQLYVSDRRIDDERRELTIEAATGEYLLQGDALVSTSSWSPASTSVRAIAQLVLDRHDFTLQAGDADATVAEVDATVWRPGITAWEYLSPLLEAASLRLWCDLDGSWYLTEREANVAGAVTLATGENITRYEDRMALDAEVWCDAVVVEYKWTDEFDLNQIAYDVAGEQPSRACLHIVRTTAYPGPGAAAGILARAQARGRVLTLSAVSTFNARPGMSATITPIEGDSQTGYVRSVTWRFPDRQMDVETRGLVDTPETSWLFVPAGISWLDIDEGVSWLDYEPEGA